MRGGGGGLAHIYIYTDDPGPGPDPTSPPMSSREGGKAAFKGRAAGVLSKRGRPVVTLVDLVASEMLCLEGSPTFKQP